MSETREPRPLNKPENPPAFPHYAPAEPRQWDASCEHGMTLRDWFAGQIAPSLIGQLNAKGVAEAAYEFADAMLAEREARNV